MGNPPRIGIVILAAGASTRLGRPKQLVPFCGTTLLRYLIREAAGSHASYVGVVVGAHRTAIEPDVDGLGVTVLYNAEWQEGLSSSIRVGVQSLPEETAAVILMLADMPAVTVRHLNELLRTHIELGKPIVASRYKDRPGAPVLFTRRFFADLRNLTGDAGAQSLIFRHTDDTAYVELPGGDIDIDTEDDVRTHLHPPFAEQK